MRNLLKKVSFLFVAVGCVAALAGCNGKGPDTPEPEEKEGYIELVDYKAYVKYDLQNVVNALGNISAENKTKVAAKQAEGNKAIEAAKSVAEVQAAFKAAKEEIANVFPLADGLYSYAGLSMGEKTNILGVLEAYAVRNGMTGISLFENGGYVMYQPRITLGTETYIVGYGFGTLAEGAITADLDAEATTAWKRYYHTYNIADPGTANYLNDQGSEVSDFYGYIGASLYTTFMNETKNGYDWVPELAKAKLTAVNPAEDGTSKVWRTPIRVGSELKYTTNSKIASRAAFNGREVKAEDYITAFKLLLTKSNGYYRGSELANQTTSAIVGAKEYYNATETTSMKDADFSGVGVRTYEEDGETWFEVTYAQAQSYFYAMYYISSSLYMPVPQEFIDLVGVKNYLGFNEDKTETPVDNSLALGAYALERWDSGQQVVYKKNPNYVHAATKYATEGVHIRIFTAAANDSEAAFKEFLAGGFDSAGIPQTQLEQYKNDPRTRKTTGDSNFKLNVNATTPETWEYLFGENGVVVQTPKEDYWEVKPCLSNAHFVKALSLSIDRNTFAAARGSIASVDYFASNYMSDPENGLSYSVTEQHKTAVSALLEGTDNGYSLELAREYFKVALTELEVAGAYKPGTKENPTVISLEIAWMYPTHETSYHNEIKQYLEDAFNDPSVSDGKYKLEVNFWVGNAWSDVYYSKLMLGQYDLGFGSISGNSLNPLDFMSVLSTDQTLSGGFTLNWGVDTNDPNADILVYDGKRWSYDALYNAGNTQAIVNKGVSKPVYTADLVEQVANLDGTYTSTIEIDITLPEITTMEIDDVVLFWTEYATSADYIEESVFETSVVVKEGSKIVITVTTTAEQAATYYDGMGFDIYYTLEFNGSVSEYYYSVYGAFEDATPAK